MTIADSTKGTAVQGSTDNGAAHGRPRPDRGRPRRIATAHEHVSSATIWTGQAESRTEAAIQALVTFCLEDLVTGRWEELLRVADEALRLCEEHGYGELRWPLWLAGGVVAAARGEDAGARELAGLIDRCGGRRASVDVQLYARFLRCLTAQASGDFDQAFREISVLGVPGVFSANAALGMWAALDFVSCALRTGRRAEADAYLALTHTVERVALSPRLSLLIAGAAAIAEHVGPLALERSLSVPGIEQWPFDLARTELAYGECLRRGRSAAIARQHLIRARAVFVELQAQPWVSRTERELRATGGPRRRSHTARGISLTPQELEIAELAASGLTNRQIAARVFVSHRTVSAHLYRVFPKLGITSRAALRDALCGAGVGPVGAPVASLQQPLSEAGRQQWIPDSNSSSSGFTQ